MSGAVDAEWLPYVHKLFELARAGGPLADGFLKWCRERLERCKLNEELAAARKRIARLESIREDGKHIENFLGWLGLRAREAWEAWEAAWKEGRRTDRPYPLSVGRDLLKLLAEDVRERLTEEYRWRKWLLARLAERAPADDDERRPAGC